MGRARSASRRASCSSSPPRAGSSAAAPRARGSAACTAGCRWTAGSGAAWSRGPGAARAELVRRWLGAFGPGTQRDLQWWTGWTVAKTKAALRDVGAVEVDLEGTGAGRVLPDDVDATAEPEPWVALLPALDTTTMAWMERGFYLGDHEQLFDTNGNAGPTVWVDGRVVGLWAQRRRRGRPPAARGRRARAASARSTPRRRPHHVARRRPCLPALPEPGLPGAGRLLGGATASDTGRQCLQGR